MFPIFCEFSATWFILPVVSRSMDSVRFASFTVLPAALLTFEEFSPTFLVDAVSSSIAALVCATLTAWFSAEWATFSIVAINSSFADVVSSINDAWVCDSSSIFWLTTANSSALSLSSPVVTLRSLTKYWVVTIMLFMASMSSSVSLRIAFLYTGQYWQYFSSLSSESTGNPLSHNVFSIPQQARFEVEWAGQSSLPQFFMSEHFL